MDPVEIEALATIEDKHWWFAERRSVLERVHAVPPYGHAPRRPVRTPGSTVPPRTLQPGRLAWLFSGAHRTPPGGGVSCTCGEERSVLAAVTSPAAPRVRPGNVLRSLPPRTAGALAVVGVVLSGHAVVLSRNRHFFFQDDVQSYYAPLWVDIGRRLRDGELPVLAPSEWMAGNYPVSYTHLTLPTNREV